MNAAVLTSRERIEYSSVDVPEVGPDDVLVRVAATGICGSDLSTYRGTHPYKRPPIILGHEFSGVIEERGSRARRFRVGDKVCALSFAPCGRCDACVRREIHLCSSKETLSHQGWQGSFAEYVVLRENMVLELPGDVDFVRGATVEPLSIGLHALRLVRHSRAGSLAILGSGNIGLSALIAAKQLGFTRVVSVDISEYKRSLALQCKADAYINAATEDLVPAVRAILANGADITLVASSHVSVMRDAAAVTKRGGEIIVVSYFGSELLLDLNYLVQNEIAVRGSALSTERDFRDVIRWLAQGKIDSLPMITHYFPLSQATIAMQLMNDGMGTRGKIMLQPVTDPSQMWSD